MTNEPPATPKSSSKAVSRLDYVYEGWAGYNLSLTRALEGLSEAQFHFRAAPEMRSVAELAWHLADGRVDWLERIDAQHAAPLREAISQRLVKETIDPDPRAVVEWLHRAWSLVEAVLGQWSVEDLSVVYPQPYQGTVYAVSRQWVIWRVMCHDIHHGGQLSQLLALQGIFPRDLTWLGGHLTEPPLWSSP